MGDKDKDTKPKKKFSKLGKLFGVSSTNLVHDGENASETSVQDQRRPSTTGLSRESSATISPNSSAPLAFAAPKNPVANGDHFVSTDHEHENDLVSPLPRKAHPQSRSNSINTTKTPSTVSPPNSSPNLASSRSHTPINTNHAISSENTSPSSLSSTNDGNSYLTFGISNGNVHQPHPSTASAISESNLQKINSSLLNQALIHQANAPVSAAKRPSPSVSRSSSVSVNPRKPVASPPTKSTPVSRSSSTKLKPATNSIGLVSNPSSTSIATSASISNASQATMPRFRMLESGYHEHHLRAAKRQEKLSSMLKDLMGAKKLRDEAKSAVPNILQGAIGPSKEVTAAKGPDKPPTLFAGLVNHIKNNTSPYDASLAREPPSSATATLTSECAVPVQSVLNPTAQDSRSFVQKYGRCQEVIGRGAFGVVRISHKKADSGSQEEILYAVKEFKRKTNESDKKYNRRLTSEFCISSSLKNINIIETLDLLKDAKGDYCEVMEFCSGGDLYTLIIASGKLEYAEADCFFKQLIRGVNYMHDMGVSHRDLKPENILLTQNGIIKITDFGNGECFKMAWEEDVQLSEGICGSSPYIAPEEFTQSSFDPRGVDIWACGVIYMAMRTGRQLWKLADPKKDEFFEEYLVKRKGAKGYDPIESLKRARCRNVIYSILDPKPERRITGKQILNSEWGREIKVCDAGEGKAHNP